MTATRLVESDGPRQLRRAAIGGYIVSCLDCRHTELFRHRIDAQDAYDNHDCNGED